MLRIDDTDNERSSTEYEDAIKEDLTWMNINWDSVEKQSSRLISYEEALETLLEKKRAYPCFETAEELSLKRKSQLSSVKIIGFSFLGIILLLSQNMDMHLSLIHISEPTRPY